MFNMTSTTYQNHTLDIKMVNKHKDKLGTGKEEELIKLDFDDTPLKLHEEYLDVFDGIQTEIVSILKV